jgi:hypothetical protein
MASEAAQSGMLGLFWVVEENGEAALIAHEVSREQAVRYGDMLTDDEGHYAFWSDLARRGPRRLRAQGFPTAPLWSEYEEWPRGRVLYDCAAQRFIIRADRQLHRPAFVRLIAERFRLVAEDASVLPDDHYRSLRRVPLPAAQLGDQAR